ncbi:MAG: ABC transporter permease [Desulfobacteraceae bacterium]|nr:ABC transporter permease [Desulfobacteraceae bacterium]
MIKSNSPMGFIFKIFRPGRYPVIPITIICIFILLAVLGQAIAPYSANQIDLRERFTPPFFMEGGSMRHLLGTDAMGRDILSRIIVGTRVSFIVAILSLTLGGVVGTALGIISGFYGGTIDSILMRTADATLAFPIILLAMLLAIIIGPSLQNVVISLGIVLWARYARVVRGEVLSLKERDFVALARIAGASGIRIMWKHLFPNIRSTLLVLLTLQVGWVIIVEASLSFIGAGIPGPTPVWGSMIAKGRDYVTTAWWIPFFPGMAVAIVCLSFNMFGDWLREALDPRMRQVGGGG